MSVQFKGGPLDGVTSFEVAPGAEMTAEWNHDLQHYEVINEDGRVSGYVKSGQFEAPMTPPQTKATRLLHNLRLSSMVLIAISIGVQVPMAIAGDTDTRILGYMISWALAMFAWAMK